MNMGHIGRVPPEQAMSRACQDTQPRQLVALFTVGLTTTRMTSSSGTSEPKIPLLDLGNRPGQWMSSGIRGTIFLRREARNVTADPYKNARGTQSDLSSMMGLIGQIGQVMVKWAKTRIDVGFGGFSSRP